MIMIDPGVWIVERCSTQDETDEVFLRIVGETESELLGRGSKGLGFSLAGSSEL